MPPVNDPRAVVLAAVAAGEHAAPAHGGVWSRVARCYRPVLLASSAALFAYLLYAVGPTTVVASFRELSWRLVLVVVFPTVVLKACDTLGWGCTFPRREVSLWRLATTLVAGQAIASTTPTGTIGGDAAKVWLLRGEVSSRECLSSLIIAETTSTASQGLLLLLGIVVARRTLSSSAPLLRIMQWLLILEIVGVAGFIAVQMRGIATRGHGLLHRLGLAGGQQAGPVAAHIDRALASFYRGEPGRLALAVTWNFLGWLTGVLEVWLILYFLKATVSIGRAVVIEAFGTSISFATFFLPVQLGIDEGGAVATFVALGMTAATGMSLSLVRRVREMAWIGIGLLILNTRPRTRVATVATRRP
jgi:glycosyltransferase 2 family protein